MDSDFWLIQKMKNGDDSAIEKFVKKYYPKIMQYCNYHIKDNVQSEDLTQETFEKFFRNLDRYKHYGKAVNYLYVIARNNCKDYFKKFQTVIVDELSEELRFEKDTIDDNISVYMALESLPEELKEVAILYFCQELKQREISEILNIGLPLVKYRIKRARDRLINQLREEEI